MKRETGTLGLLSLCIMGFLTVWWMYQIDIPASSGRDEQAILQRLFGNGDLPVSFESQKIPELTFEEYVDDDVFEEPVSQENHIFFLETTCLFSQTAHRNLTAHQICAVEAAVSANLDSKVFLMYTCNGHVNSTLLTKVILSYPNLRLWQISMKQLVLKTPLENRHYNTLQSVGVLPQLLSVIKYGGTYLNIGAVLAVSLELLGDNFVSYQDSGNLIALNLQSYRNVLQQHVFAMKDTDNPASAFQQLLSEIVKNFCKISQVTQNIADSCAGVNFLPASRFLTVPFTSEKPNVTAVNTSAETSDNSFGRVMWDAKGLEDLLPNAELYCPVVYEKPDKDTIIMRAQK